MGGWRVEVEVEGGGGEGGEEGAGGGRTGEGRAILCCEDSPGREGVRPMAWSGFG